MGQRYRITEHAVVRYRDRLRPGLGMKQARSELVKLAAQAERVPDAPQWIRPIDPSTSGYLICGDVALVLQGNFAVTVLVKGSRHPNDLERRRAAKRRRRVAQAYRRGK